MAAESVTFSGGISYTGAQTVWTKARWADSWTQRDDLLCTSVTWSAQPAVPTATLYRRYGPTKERTVHTPADRSKLSLEGHFVKIEIECADGDKLWYGYVDLVTDEPSGLVGSTPCGVQTFACLGIINVLAHQLVTTTPYVYRELATNKVRLSKAGTTFNDVRDGRILHTKSTVRLPKKSGGPEAYIHTPKGHYLIDYDQDNETWSTKDICEHLLAFHYPVDEENEIRIPFEWDDLDLLPVNDKPTIATDHRTLLSILDELCTGRLMLGYYATVEPPGDGETLEKVVLKVYTLLKDDLTLSDSTISANPNTVDITMIADQATTVSTTLDLATRANQVIVRGAKRIVVCTLPFRRGGLGSDPLVFRPATNAGDLTTQPSGIIDPFDAYSRRIQWLSNSQNQLWLRGYVIRQDWNWLLASGQQIFSDGSSQYFPYPYDLKIADRLPLREGHDYLDTPDDKNATGDYLPILIFGHKLVYASSTALNRSPDKYVLFRGRTKQELICGLDQLPYDITFEPLPNDGRLGGKFDVDGASIETLKDEDSTLAASPPNLESPHLATYRRSDLYATLAFEDDRRIEGRFPADEDVADVDAVRRRVLDFGDVFQQIKILGGTYLGVDQNDDLVRPIFDIDVRDDQDSINDLAKQAYQFYSQDRKVLRLNSNRASAVLDIGKMVSVLNPSTVHESQINTVITEITIQTAYGQPGSVRAATFSLTTAAGELDFLAMVPKARV